MDWLLQAVIVVICGAIGGAMAAVLIDAIKHRGFFWNA